MRFDSLPAPLLSLLAISLIQPSHAGLIPDLLESLEDLQNFVKRCENPCGYYGQLCCASGDTCYTDTSGQAQCGSGGALTQVAATATGGNWQYYTTTYVQTDLKTVTQTYSSYMGAITSSSTSCSYNQGQSPCGNTCCNSGEYCQQAGVCAVVPGSSGYYSSFGTVTVTNSASSGSTTVPFQTPVGTNGAVLTGTSEESGGGGGLSGGAIAGIVIGVILGIILLLLICACCCFKGLLDTLLGFFGLGPRRRRRREEVDIYEERHHRSDRHGGGRTWYGAPKRSGTVVEEKRKSSGGGMGGIAKAGIFLGGLAAVLGLKRSRDKRRDDGSSSGYSYYDSNYHTSSSSSSSAGRTRGSRSRSRSRI